MADYSYAGLSVVVRAVTEPMAASIRQAALTAGDQAAAGLEVTLAKGVREGMTKGWQDASRVTADGLKTLYPVAAEAGRNSLAAFASAFVGGMKDTVGKAAGAALDSSLTIGARKAAASAAAAASMAFDAELVPRMKAIGTSAGDALSSMSLSARTAAASAAVAASLAFDATIQPRLKAIGAAAGAVLEAPWTLGARTAAASAAAAAVLAFDAIIKPGLAKAGTDAAEALSSMSLGARKAAASAALAANLAFETTLLPAITKTVDAASAVLNSRLVQGAKSAAVRAGAGFADTIRAVTVTGVTKAADAASAVLSSRMVAGAREAAVAAGTSFVTRMGEITVAGMEKVAAKSSTVLAGVGKSAAGALGAVGEVAGIGATAFLYTAVKAGVAYNQLYSQSLKAFKVILGTQGAAVDMMAKLTAFAKTSPFPRQTFISATQTMLGFGVSADKIIPTLSAIQDAVAVTRGASTGTFNSIVQAIAKVDSTGKFTARTLNQLGVYGIDAAALIGKGMGMTSAQVRESITKDKLDTSKAMDALITQMQIKFAGGAAGLKSTWTGVKQSVSAATRDIGSSLVAPFISPTGGGLAIQWANKLGKALWGIEPFVTPLVNALMYSLKPAIDAINHGIDWLLNQVDKLSGKNIDAATNAVKKFGAAGVAASLGVSALAGGKLVTQLPIVGDMVKKLISPFSDLLDVLGEFAAPIAVFALIAVNSKKFRDAVIGFGKGLLDFAKPILGALITGFKLISPYIAQFAGWLGDKLAPLIARLTPLLKPLGDAVGKFLVGDFKAMIAVVKFLFPVLKLLGGWIFNVIGWVFDLLVPFVKFVTWLLANFFPILTNVVNAIRTSWDDALKWTVSTWGAISKWVAARWGDITGAIAKAIDWITTALPNAWSDTWKSVTHWWGTITGAITGAWSGLITTAEGWGGSLIDTLKTGVETAMKDIGNWIKSAIVDPIVNGVRSWFGLKPVGGSGGSSGSSGGKAGPAGMSIAAGAQGSGGGGGAQGSGGGGGGGGGVIAGALGGIGDVFKTMITNTVQSDPVQVAEHVFGSVTDALGWIVVKGLAFVGELGSKALGALEGIPGVKGLLSFLGGLWHGVTGFVGGLFGGGGGKGIGGLVPAATAFNGHQYVWGGGANSQTGFDCSSFVNMLAGSLGLPIPGGFRAPSDQHGPVTGNWLTFNALKTIPYDSMLPGDIYVNPEHMGIVTGLGTGFAARSTDTGTGPQTVPRGLYTIRRFPGNSMASGVTGNADLLAESLAGLLSQGAGLAPVISAGSTANLRTIADYMATSGWSLPGAAGVAGNVYRESGGDPLSFGSGGRGLIGWTPPGTLPSAAFTVGNPSLALSRQLPLVDTFFVNNMGAKYWKLANAQSDAGLAALVIMNMGERPAGSSQSDPFFPGTGTSGGSQRAAMARTIFEELRKSALVKMAGGGVITEPVVGIGASGVSYLLGEAGNETVLPASLAKQLLALLKKLAAPAKHGTLGNVVVGPTPVVNVILPASPVPAAAKPAVAAAAAATVASAATTAASTVTATAAKDAAKKSASAATALAKAQAENAKYLHDTQASNAARLAKAVAQNSKDLAEVHSTAAQRKATALATNAREEAAVAEANAARAAATARSSATTRNKAAALTAQHLADQAQENATRLAKAAAESNKQLTAVEAENAARLAKAKATNATELSKTEASNAARLAKAQSAYNAAAAAAGAAAAKAAGTAVKAAAKAPFHSTLGDVMIRYPLGVRPVATVKAAAAKAASPNVAAAAKAAAASAAALHAAHVAHEAHLDHLYALAHPYVPPPAPARSTYVAPVRETTARAVSTVSTAASTYAAQEKALGERMAKYGTVTINIHPAASQSETEIAAAVSRTMNWSAQGGAR